MKCPNCKDVNLLMPKKQGVEIDYCPECRGIWLDKGELEKIIEKNNNEIIVSTKEKNGIITIKIILITKEKKESFLETCLISTFFNYK